MDCEVLLVNLDNLETVQLRTDRGIESRIVIDGMEFVKVNCSIACKIAQAIQNMIQAVERGEFDQYRCEQLKVKAEEIWRWTENKFGKKELQEKWREIKNVST